MLLSEDMDTKNEENPNSDERLIEERKKQVKNFFLKNWHYLQYIGLLIIVWIGISIRSKPLANLIDATTGKYISLELDSTVFLRYAKYIVEHGRLFDVDPMRFYPLGADLNNIGTFTSYFVAYLYKFLHFFIPSITVEFVDVIYPIIAMAILTVFLFLLVRRLFDWKVGLLSALFINIIPSFLFRSLGGSSDHDILAMMFIIMAFYFYVAGWQSERIKGCVMFGVLTALITVLARESAGAGNFIFLILGSFAILEIFLSKVDEKDYYLYSSWLIVVTIMNVFLHGFESGFILFVSSITTGITYLAFLFASVSYIMFKTKLKSYFSKINLPENFTGIIVSSVIFSIVALIFFGFDFFTNKIQQIYDVLFKFYAETRWTLTVAENHRPFVTDWTGQMGKLFVYSMMTGSVILFYHMAKVFEKKRIAYFLTTVYGLFIFGYTFSRYSGASIFNGISNLSRLVFFSSIIGFALIIGFSYLKTYLNNKEVYNKIKLIDKKYAFVFVWFFVMIFAATSAIRLLFEFSVIAVIVASYFFVAIAKYSWTHKKKYVKYPLLIALLFILINPFSYAQGIIIKNYTNSLNQATFSGPGYNKLWQEAGEWVRDATEEGTIFAHWWDYGYWVQEGFQRATITDGGNFILWWNYLMGRSVLTAQNFTEPLWFLYAHDADYLLIVSDEIGKYPAYSTIGSNENYDRRAFIPSYTMDSSNHQETRNGTLILYSGNGFPLEENFIYQGRLLPAGSAIIGGFILEIKQNGEKVSFSNLTVVIFHQNKRFDVPLSCLVFGTEKIEFPNNGGIHGCLKILSVFSSNGDINPIGAAMYLSPRVKDSLFARLYLNDEKNEYFELVYSTPGLPLGIIDGNLIGPHKIWKINYPDKFIVSEEDKEYYLRTSYPDPKLYQI